MTDEELKEYVRNTLATEVEKLNKAMERFERYANALECAYKSAEEARAEVERLLVGCQAAVEFLKAN